MPYMMCVCAFLFSITLCNKNRARPGANTILYFADFLEGDAGQMLLFKILGVQSRCHPALGKNFNCRDCILLVHIEHQTFFAELTNFRRVELKFDSYSKNFGYLCQRGSVFNISQTFFSVWPGKSYIPA